MRDLFLKKRKSIRIYEVIFFGIVLLMMYNLLNEDNSR